MNQKITNPKIIVYDQDGNREVPREEKKIDFVLGVNKQLQDKIEHSKILKWTAIVTVTAAGLIILGYFFKVVNFAATEYKVLACTLRNE